MKVIVTVKLPRNRDHDPHNKKQGTCPVFGGMCSDVTGEHHSGLVDEAMLDSLTKRFHVTRVEAVS